MSAIETAAPTAERVTRRGELLHILGVSFGVAIAVGGMIGVGILRTPSSIAAFVPDGGIILALWALGAVHAGLEANVISELSTLMPRAGGFYIYAQRAFGDVGGLAVGWTTWISRLASTAALSIAFADFTALLWPAAAPFTVEIAVAMQLVMFGLNAIGLREGRNVQQVTSFAKALALAAFCVVAFLTAAPVAPSHVIASAVGWTGVIAAYRLIVGAYAGWYEPAFMAEENADPGRSVPRAIFLGLAASAVLYIGINAALLHALGTAEVARVALPYTTVLAHFAGPAAGTIVAACALVIVASCANAGMMTAPRIVFALARDGLLPGFIRTVNAGGSPVAAYAMTAAGSILLTLSGSFTLLFGMIATLGAAAFVLTIAAVFVLRRREPSLPRPWQAIGYPWLPAIVLALDFVLLVLFLNVNRTGAIYAAALWLACIPFALIARRAAR